MKGSLLTLVFYTHVLFLQSYGSLVGARHGKLAARHSFRRIRTGSSRLGRSEDLASSLKIPGGIVNIPPTYQADKRASSIDTVRERRINTIVSEANSPDNNIPAWYLSSHLHSGIFFIAESYLGCPRSTRMENGLILRSTTLPDARHVARTGPLKSTGSASVGRV